MKTGGTIEAKSGRRVYPATFFARLAIAAACFGMLGSGQAQDAGDKGETFAKEIAAMKAVGAEGAGNEAAGVAWKKLTSNAGGEVLPHLIDALDGASPLAANWLRTAAQVVVDNEQAAGREIPLDLLGAKLLDKTGGAEGRALAFDFIEQVSPESAARLVPGMLGDSSPDLRAKAVQRLIDEAAAFPETEADTAALLYRQALGGATDALQVQAIAKALEKHGSPVDLPRHFGFLTHWHVVAPFDNTGRAGFAAVFPPENGVDLASSYPGKKEGESVSWQPLATADPYGKVDLNKPYGLLKGVTGYAYTEFESKIDRPAELRLGCKNGWKIWLNGEFIFGRDEYHRGQRIDQYRLPVQLKAGKNTLLVKLCQDEQEENWTVEWEFQLRVCDESGTAILAPDRLPTPVEEKSSSRRGAGAKDTRDKDK